MQIGNTNEKYGAVAKTLHWLVFLMIAGLLAVGLIFEDMPKGDDKLRLQLLHVSFGMLLLMLMLARVAWRLAGIKPAAVTAAPRWQEVAARWVHRGLYLLVFAQMLTGLASFAYNGRPIPFFGLFAIPNPLTENHDLHEELGEIHEFFWKLLAALVVVHVVAALYHHFVRKDSVLKRMTFGA